MKLHSLIVSLIEKNPDDYSRKILEWASSKGLETVILHDGQIYPADSAQSCDRCDNWYKKDDDFYDVWVSRRRTEAWCEDCRDNHACYCSYSERSFDDSDQLDSIEVDGDLCCEQFCEGSVYYWESDESYHYDPEPEDEEDDIPSYHELARPWDSKPVTGLAFGVELEVLAKENRREIYEIAKDNGLLCETDGSLDDRLGAELIGPPLKFEDYKKPDSIWNKFLEQSRGKCLGFDAGTGYGFHVSINRQALGHLHCGKLMVFVHSNKALCQKIAGRSSEQWARHTHKKISSSFRKGEDGSYRPLEEGNKFEALAIRSQNRLEMRIFRSTLNKEGFMKNIEFVHASISYTKDASFRKLTEGDFMDWLSKNRKTYKNLHAKLFPATVAVSEEE